MSSELTVNASETNNNINDNKNVSQMNNDINDDDINNNINKDGKLSTSVSTERASGLWNSLFTKQQNDSVNPKTNESGGTSNGEWFDTSSMKGWLKQKSDELAASTSDLIDKNSTNGQGASTSNEKAQTWEDVKERASQKYHEHTTKFVSDIKIEADRLHAHAKSMVEASKAKVNVNPFAQIQADIELIRNALDSHFGLLQPLDPLALVALAIKEPNGRIEDRYIIGDRVTAIESPVEFIDDKDTGASDTDKTVIEKKKSGVVILKPGGDGDVDYDIECHVVKVENKSETVQMLLHYAKLAEIAYGDSDEKTALEKVNLYAGLTGKSFEGADKLPRRFRLEAILKTSTKFCPAHMLVVIEEQRPGKDAGGKSEWFPVEVLLLVRGTKSLSDIFTDCTFECVDYPRSTDKKESTSSADSGDIDGGNVTENDKKKTAEAALAAAVETEDVTYGNESADDQAATEATSDVTGPASDVATKTSDGAKTSDATSDVPTTSDTAVTATRELTTATSDTTVATTSDGVVGEEKGAAALTAASVPGMGDTTDDNQASESDTPRVGKAHSGLMESGEQLVMKYGDRLAELEAQGAQIVVVGHSLGAGAGAICTMSLKESGKVNNIRCFAFACPALVDDATAKRNEAYITTIVNQHDIIARFSGYSLLSLHRIAERLSYHDDLLDDLSEVKETIKATISGGSKHSHIAASSKANTSASSQKNGEGDEKDNNKRSSSWQERLANTLDAGFDAAVATRLKEYKENHAKKLKDACSKEHVRVVNADDGKSVKVGERCVPRLVAPGRVIHLYFGGSDNTEPSVALVPNEAFAHIHLSKTCISDHLMGSYLTALEKLVE